MAHPTMPAVQPLATATTTCGDRTRGCSPRRPMLCGKSCRAHGHDHPPYTPSSHVLHHHHFNIYIYIYTCAGCAFLVHVYTYIYRYTIARTLVHIYIYIMWKSAYMHVYIYTRDNIYIYIYISHGSTRVVGGVQVGNGVQVAIACALRQLAGLVHQVPRHGQGGGYQSWPVQLHWHPAEPECVFPLGRHCIICLK
jgi:hypothetical protein